MNYSHPVGAQFIAPPGTLGYNTPTQRKTQRTRLFFAKFLTLLISLLVLHSMSILSDISACKIFNLGTSVIEREKQVNDTFGSGMLPDVEYTRIGDVLPKYMKEIALISER
jgi:hypothetical protein